jgi:hypothetical protein
LKPQNVGRHIGKPQTDRTLIIFKNKTMTEEQAKTMLKLLTEISNKLTDISEKISTDYESDTVIGKLNDINTNLMLIENNTTKEF